MTAFRIVPVLLVALAALACSTPKGIETDKNRRRYDRQEAWAMKVGKVGYRSTSGLLIEPGSQFVALPGYDLLGWNVEVDYKGRYERATVEEVGPWSTLDNWILNGARPKAEAGLREPSSLQEWYGPPTNPAGVALSDGLWNRIGIPTDSEAVQIGVRLISSPQR